MILTIVFVECKTKTRPPVKKPRTVTPVVKTPEEVKHEKYIKQKNQINQIIKSINIDLPPTIPKGYKYNNFHKYEKTLLTKIPLGRVVPLKLSNPIPMDTTKRNKMLPDLKIGSQKCPLKGPIEPYIEQKVGNDKLVYTEVYNIHWGNIIFGGKYKNKDVVIKLFFDSKEKHDKWKRNKYNAEMREVLRQVFINYACPGFAPQILALFKDNQNNIYLVMEKVKGSNNDVPFKDIYSWLFHMYNKLDILHRFNFFHTDIGERNIIKILFIDFGWLPSGGHALYTRGLLRHKIYELKSKIGSSLLEDNILENEEFVKLLMAKDIMSLARFFIFQIALHNLTKKQINFINTHIKDIGVQKKNTKVVIEPKIIFSFIRKKIQEIKEVYNLSTKLLLDFLFDLALEKKIELTTSQVLNKIKTLLPQQKKIRSAL